MDSVVYSARLLAQSVGKGYGVGSVAECGGLNVKEYTIYSTLLLIGSFRNTGCQSIIATGGKGSHVSFG